MVIFPKQQLGVHCASTHAPAYVAQFTSQPLDRGCEAFRRRRLPSRVSPRPVPRASAARLPVAPQLPRAIVAYLMRHRNPPNIIWIYPKYALSSTFSLHICGFVKSPTNINGLYCKVTPNKLTFVRSAMEFYTMANAARRRVRHMVTNNTVLAEIML
ncbi:unnamed protein product [Colias eurytheme]|nr:unnamed protein product [Colias eurytheme]